MTDEGQETRDGMESGGVRPGKRLPDLGRLERKLKPGREKPRPAPSGSVSRRPSMEEPVREPSWHAAPLESSRLERQLVLAGKRERMRLTETDERFLSRYSFGTACGLYYLNRALWPYLVFAVVVGLSPRLVHAPWWFTGIVLVSLLVCPVGFAFLCVLAGPVAYSAPYLMEGPIRSLMLGGGVLFYLAAGVFGFLIAIAGIYARRQRWQAHDWASFADFEETEKRWQAVGIVFWLGVIVAIIYVFATNRFEELFPIFWGTDFA